MKTSARILLIDDDSSGRTALRRALERLGYEVEPFAAGAPALQALGDGGDFDLVVTDIKMPEMDGLEVLRHVQEKNKDLPVILITAFGTIENAVEAMALGARDYLTKPLSLPEVRAKVAKALEGSRLMQENQRLAEENTRLRDDAVWSQGLQALVGAGPAMTALKERLLHVAPTPSTVLIVGDSGTGKELLARAIHDESPRSGRPFLPINCAAIPKDILESELFGHERGAFTGAVGRKPGKFEVANGGTLFLDEIGEMPLGMQAKLLRVLEEKSFMRVGGVEEIAVDVRIVAATNANLTNLVETGEFRADLYYRLKVVTLDVLPLCRRPEDIPTLVEHFLQRLGEEHHREQLSLSPAALAILEKQLWPGNVRELRNMLESMVVMSSGNVLDVPDLPAEYGGRDAVPAASGVSPVALAAPLPGPATDGGATNDPDDAGVAAAPTYEAGLPMAELEKRHILKTLAEQDNNRTRAARVLGIGRRTLQRKLEEYKDQGDEVPPPAPD
jgi:DNA-binding NtrC family response regulator